MNKGTQKDLKYQVDMSQVLGGYFGDVTIAQSFIEIGIIPILHQLPQKISMADFGGGQGGLLAIVRDYLVAQGFNVEAYVVDSNPEFLEACEKKNLKVEIPPIAVMPSTLSARPSTHLLTQMLSSSLSALFGTIRIWIW
jgi:hypothetical protein